MNKETFIKEVNNLGYELTDKQIDQFETYANYLLEYNSHTNLTAIKEKEQVYLKHFFDSITIIKSYDFNNANNLIDIGTGAGFPGMVIKILYPNIKVTLLDSNNKKINFLKELSKKLNLENITFCHERAEEYCTKHRETFDIVTARAVSNMTLLTEICMPFVKENGYFIPLKGSNTDEITESEFAIKTLGGKIEEIINFKLPYEESGRNIVKIKKISKTPLQYPRRYDKIMKKPLKINTK